MRLAQFIFIHMQKRVASTDPPAKVGFFAWRLDFESAFHSFVRARNVSARLRFSIFAFASPSSSTMTQQWLHAGQGSLSRRSSSHSIVSCKGTPTCVPSFFFSSSHRLLFLRTICCSCCCRLCGKTVLHFRHERFEFPNTRRKRRVLLAGSASVVVSLFADCIILLNECIESNHLFRNVLARPVLLLVLRRRTSCGPCWRGKRASLFRKVYLCQHSRIQKGTFDDPTVTQPPSFGS